MSNNKCSTNGVTHDVSNTITKKYSKKKGSAIKDHTHTCVNMLVDVIQILLFYTYRYFTYLHTKSSNYTTTTNTNSVTILKQKKHTLITESQIKITQEKEIIIQK